MLQKTLAGVTVTPQTALRIVDVLACVRLLAESASTLPLIAYRRSGDGRERFEGRIARLLDRPAPATTQANLVSQLVGCLALRGNAYLGKFRNADGEIEQLALLPNDRVAVELIAGQPFYTVTNDRGERTVHGPEDVLHFKGLSLDGLVGLSPIGQARQALGLAVALDQYGASLFGNHAAPQGVLSVPQGPLQEDVMANLRSSWETRHKGSDKAGRVAVLSGDVTFTPVSLSPQDAEYVESRRLSTQEICRLFRVPSHLVNARSENSLTYSTSEMDSANYVRYSLAPLLTVVEQALTADRDLSPESVYVEFLLEGFLRPDTATRAQVYETGLRNGYLTVNEVRRAENLPPLPGGDLPRGTIPELDEVPLAA